MRINTDGSNRTFMELKYMQYGDAKESCMQF